MPSRPIPVEWLQKRLDDLAEKHRVPGAVLGVLDDAQQAVVATGVLNQRTGVVTTTDSIFQIGSITKIYTATQVLQLVDDGRVALDDAITTYLPDLRFAEDGLADEITVRMLLAHTAGVDGDHFTDTSRGDDCLERYVESCTALGRHHQPGAMHSYCNSGYAILGRLIEVVTGAVWDLALQRMLAPLNLSATVTLPEDAILRRAAVGHARGNEGEVAVVPRWLLPRGLGPAGIVIASASDVLGFVRVHLEDGRAPDGTAILSPASIKAMQEPQVELVDRWTLGTAWGLGWILTTWDGERVILHDGATLGHNSYLRVLPDQRFAMVLLTNSGSARALFDALAAEVLHDLAGVTVPSLPSPSPAGFRPDLARYWGRFQRYGGEFEVTEDEGRLLLTKRSTGPEELASPPITLDLAQVDDGLFIATHPDTPVRTPAVFFDFDEHGRPGWLQCGARAHRRAE